MNLGSQGLTCFVLVDGFWNHNPLALPVWSEARRSVQIGLCSVPLQSLPALARIEGPWMDVLLLFVLTKTMKGSWGLF